MRPVLRAINLTTFMCRLSGNLEASSSLNPQGLFRPVLELLYLLICSLAICVGIGEPTSSIQGWPKTLSVGINAAVTLSFACTQDRQTDILASWLLYLITDCYVMTCKLMSLAAGISLFLEIYMWTFGRTKEKIPLELMTSLTVLSMTWYSDFTKSLCTTRRLRTAPLWVISQRVLVITYICFGKNYRSHLRDADNSLAQPEGNKKQRQKILIFIYPIYNHNWRNISTIYIYILQD
jgi:hypothetical protein